MKLITLIISLPTENATVRQRAWRALKASGAAVLRDGVYLMPERDTCRVTLEAVAADVLTGGGSAHVLRAEATGDTNYAKLFDRSQDYAALLSETAQVRDVLTTDTVMDALKQARKLRKSFISLVEIDFFPGEAQRQVDNALHELELACTRTLAPDEPQAFEGVVARLPIADYQGRTWATRQRPWIDRLASAWLIYRFIDPQAKILWLTSPADCPPDALGFDFDGATFSHVANRVTFEVLLASFALEHAGFTRMGLLVHYLDVGGVQPPEAAGVESVLSGLRAAIQDDEQLLAAASTVFDGLLTSFQMDSIPLQPERAE